MLSNDIILDPSVAISAGSSSPKTFSLRGNPSNAQSVRSNSAVAGTNPQTVTFAHSVRTAKGFKTTANASVPAPDLLFDRHLSRVDKNWVQTTRLDPDYRANLSVQLLIEVPRLGTESPTVVQIADTVKELASRLLASSNADLIRLLAGEV